VLDRVRVREHVGREGTAHPEADHVAISPPVVQERLQGSAAKRRRAAEERVAERPGGLARRGGSRALRCETGLHSGILSKSAKRAQGEDMDLELNGKTAIVTDGSRGIGKAIARELAREG